MAKTAITPVTLKFNEAAALPATVAVGAEGAAVKMTGADHKTLLVIEATAATKATIAAGNGLQGVRPLEVTFAAAGTQVITVESGPYLQVSGADKGAVVVTGATLKLAAVVLP